MAGPLALAFAIVAAGSVLLRAEPFETIADAYRKRPSPGTRAAVVHFANAHPKDREGALALLALGAVEVDQGLFADAAKHLDGAGARLPLLGDYAAYLRATALYGLKRPAESLPLLEAVWKTSPESPLAGKAALLAARCLLDLHQPDRAIEVIAVHRPAIPDASAELARAQALEAAGKTAEAAGRYQWVWYEYPLSAEAPSAEAALVRLRGSPAYPKESSELLLARGRKLMDGREYARAASALQASLPRMTHDDQESARVMLGGIRYLRRDASACDYLRSLQLTAPEADAERLYYVVVSAFRAGRQAEAQDALARLERWHGKSNWRLQALLAAASRYAMDRQPAASQPIYRACFESFPEDAQAPGCHWKYVWQNYLDSRSAARDALLDHLRRYPNSEKAPAALYFLGRIAQNGRDFASARVYYEEIDTLYPNQYYTELARQRLREGGVASAARSAAVVAQLATLHLPDRRAKADLTANPATQVRLDRARLLALAGLYDLAEGELRFAGRNSAQPQVIALALAELADHRQTPDLGIRFIKHYALDYLELPFNGATERLWKLAFPIPFREALEQNARLSALDPYLVAALIRQESEFNPRAVSHSKAYGLTQILPGTGRQLSRKMNLRGFRTAMLYAPEVNLRLGTFYLRLLLDQLQGHWEETLASYNAGKGRVTQWLGRAQFNEPAEFVESIPIAETRNYVQSVLRNADVYRRLYGVAPTPPAAAPGPAGRPAPASRARR
ncbi:MAG: transglycosylase SLT domain-containing protein [Bryobacteraceae bacterium]